MFQNYSIYQEVAVQSSSPMKLILMLYEGAINFLNKAIQCGNEGDVKNKNVYANKARDIIVELNQALNMDEGGELATGLRRIYRFMNWHLTQANWRNENKGLVEVKQMLTYLMEGWEDAYGQAKEVTFPGESRLSGMTV